MEIDPNAALVVALLQMLVDRKVLKGDENEIMRELLNRKDDLVRYAAAQLKAGKRAEDLMRALWDVPPDAPKQ